MNIKITNEESQNGFKKFTFKSKKPKFFKFNQNRFIFLIILITIIALTVSGITYILYKPSIFNTIITASNVNPTNTPEVPKIIYVESPINGTFISEDKLQTLEKNKVLAVMIENLGGIDGARPQSGLQDADIVYETEAEGDITRFMALFWNHNLEQNSSKLPVPTVVKPIRSARKYFLDWEQEYNNPVYMHIGQAESTNPDTNALGALSQENILDLTGATNSFNRDHKCEKIKALEHCAFSDTSTLWKIAQSNGWTNLGNIQKLLYKDDNILDTNASSPLPTNKIVVSFESDFATYGVNWTYDPITNSYLRFDGTNKPFIDANTNSQVNTKVLIVQKTNISVSPDDGKYHKVIKTIGSGDAWVLQDGKSTLATWQKDSLTSRTRYFDKLTGKELSLNRGKMWITVTGKSPVLS